MIRVYAAYSGDEMLGVYATVDAATNAIASTITMPSDVPPGSEVEFKFSITVYELRY